MSDQMYHLDLDAHPCVCGHGGALHYGDGDEEGPSGIVLRRSRCHGADIKSEVGEHGFATIRTTICACTSYSEGVRPTAREQAL